MKILFFIDSLLSGGKERRLVGLLKGLQAYPDIQYEIAVMDKDIYFQEVFEQSNRIHYLIRKWSKDPGIFFKLRKVCKTVRPDIIHTWGFLTSMYALPVAKLGNIKFVNGYITYALPVKVFSKLWFGAKLTFPLSDAVVANSMAGLRAHGLEISDKNMCIVNGFDFSRLDNIVAGDSIRKQFGIQTEYVIGMTANFTAAKDYETYLKAAQKILLKKRKDVTFLCIGAGAYLTQAKKHAGGEFSHNIKFLGEQESIESIVNILDAGVLACNTIGHGEGVSNAIMEYMALGKPTVATDSGGNMELVVDKQTGFIVQPFNAEEMALRIEELLEDVKLKARLGEAGRKRIETEFNMNKMTTAYVALYKRLLGNSN